MKKRSYIVPMIIAIICMMVIMAVPHHHHAMGVCLMQEICHQDGRINDSHTHHAEGADAHHVIPVTGKHLPLGLQAGKVDGQSSWLPFFMLGLPGLNVGQLCVPLFVTHRTGAFALPAWHGQLSLAAHGLRAPPFAVL